MTREHLTELDQAPTVTSGIRRPLSVDSAFRMQQQVKPRRVSTLGDVFLGLRGEAPTLRRQLGSFGVDLPGGGCHRASASGGRRANAAAANGPHRARR